MSLLLSQLGGAGAVSLDGHADIASGGSGALSVNRGIDGHGDVASEAKGSLSVAWGLSSHADVASEAKGTLSVNRGVSGHADVASGASGTLSVNRGLTGMAPQASGASGDARVAWALDGKGSAAAYASGDLTVTSGASVPLDGKAIAAAYATGTLSVLRGLSATAAISVGASGVLSVPLRGITGMGHGPLPRASGEADGIPVDAFNGIVDPANQSGGNVHSSAIIVVGNIDTRDTPPGAVSSRLVAIGGGVT